MVSNAKNSEPAAAGRGYGQYCPLALAAEILCRRWSLLVVSRVIDGCETFNDIHRGVPRISPSLLSTRLGELEHAGIIRREKQPNGRGHRYRLTEAGRDLDDIVMAIAVWGQRWARDMTTDDLDPGFLAWSMHTRLNIDAMPAGRTVMHFKFSGAPFDCDRFWLVVDGGSVDMCLKDPGHEPDLVVRSDLRLFVEAWRGIRDLRALVRRGEIVVEGPTKLRRALPNWLLLSMLAPYPREAVGRERDVAKFATNRR
ncbi:MAG: helix-turn-helix domain-containing protein [Pseudomonadota bacterium]